MKDSDKSLLLGFVGVAVAAASIIFVAKPNYEQTKNLEAEIAGLQARLNELQQKEAKRDWYVAETERLNAEFDNRLNAFPADLNQEVSIMFMQGVKDSFDFKIGTLGLGKPEQFYTLGTAGADMSLTPVETAPAETAEAAPAETAEGVTVADTTASSAYECYRAAFPLSYDGTYKDLKNVITYINTFPDRMAVDTVDIAYNADTERYTGNMSVYCYSIESADRPERTVDLNEIEIGVDNIFNGGTAGSSENTLNKYDENDGAAIESEYDFYAMLNASTSDVSAKVVGQNGSGKDASVISNSDNTTSTLNFEFYEQDGKNYCKYTVDNSKSYEAEVTSAEDIKLLIQSSARKDSDDKVAVRVTINNTTSLPVYVKVSGDDTTSPRVNIASKTGSVKVYK